MSQLRDFLYLDSAKLHSFVSQIHGGLVSEILDTIKQQSGLSLGAEVGIPTLGHVSLGTSKDKDKELQQRRQLTDPAYFNVLYQYLREKSEIEDVTPNDIQIRRRLSDGQFVELEGIAEPPVVEHWIGRVRTLIEFIDKNRRLFAQTQTKDQRRTSQALSQQQMQLFKGMVDFLDDYMRLSRRDPGKQYVRITPGGSSHSVWCGLIPEYITTPLQAVLPAKVHVVGKVEKLLKEGEVYKIVDLAQFNQPVSVTKLLEALNALGPLIGQKPISEKDLQVEYPDFLVAPIAIYQ